MKTEQNDPGQANGSGSAADHEAAETSGQKAVSTPSENPSDGRTEAQSPPQSVTPGKSQEVHSLKRAAQLEHKPSADGGSTPNGAKDCAVAGGDTPQPPRAAGQVTPPKRKRLKKRDNHVSIRLTEEEWEVIEKHMALTGMTLSEAIRDIISTSADKSGSIYMRPKSPPEHLEKLIGEQSMWRKEFSKAKPRLNIPTPASDKERHAEVTKWRAEADRLLKAIPKLEELLSLALGVMTSLTTERVVQITNGYTTLGTWKSNFEKKDSLASVAFLQALMDLLIDAGIKPRPKK